jgi:hypothetical protein
MNTIWPHMTFLSALIQFSKSNLKILLLFSIQAEIVAVWPLFIKIIFIFVLLISAK